MTACTQRYFLHALVLAACMAHQSCQACIDQVQAAARGSLLRCRPGKPRYSPDARRERPIHNLWLLPAVSIGAFGFWQQYRLSVD
jgi:hypothetical protein